MEINPEYLLEGLIVKLQYFGHLMPNLGQFSHSVMSDSATPWTKACQASLSIKSWSLLNLMSIKSVMPSNHLILCCRLFSSLRSFPASGFPNELILCIRWPKYWSFSFNISPSNEYAGLISFRIDWLDLLVVQGTLKSLLPTPQFKSINSSALSFLYSPTVTSLQFFHSPHLSSLRGSLVPLYFRVVSSAYLRLLIFLMAASIPVCDSSSPAFRMMYSAYKLNKQSDNIRP